MKILGDTAFDCLPENKLRGSKPKNSFQALTDYRGGSLRSTLAPYYLTKVNFCS